MATAAPRTRNERLEECARRVSRLADCSIFVRSQGHYDDLEEEADDICRTIKAVFRGR